MNYPNDVEKRLETWRNAAGGLSAALEGGPDANWHDPRAAYDRAFAEMFDAPAATNYKEADLRGIPVLQVTPDTPTGGCTVLYFHGGGYASGAASGYRALAGHLALAIGAEVFVPDYRLAPQHLFPAPIEDAVAAYEHLLENGVDPHKLVLGGDSAGGAMMLTVMRKAVARGIAMPGGAFAYSPWADLSHSGQAITANAERDPLVKLPFLEALASAFLGEMPATNADASPVFADFESLPPVLIQVGGQELMLSDAVRLSERLAMSDVPVQLQITPRMFHVFQLFAGLLPEADAALAETATFAQAVFADIPNSTPET